MPYSPMNIRLLQPLTLPSGASMIHFTGVPARTVIAGYRPDSSVERTTCTPFSVNGPGAAPDSAPTAPDAVPTAPDALRLGTLAPERLHPCESIESPSTTTSTAPTVMTFRVNFPPSAVLSAPSPNISGTVPRLNSSIDSAPAKGLPVESA